jgi:thiol-disulfide isomerase/thioredoxin
LDSSSQEAKTLLDNYGIERLPAIILRGEINKTSIQNFKQSGDALVFSGVTPPYVDAATGKIIGRVSAIVVIAEDCEACDDFGSVIESLKQNSVVFSEVRQISFGSSEAEDLITKYEIQRVPSLLLSTDIDAYHVAQNLGRAGFDYKGGYYVAESGAPYVETDTHNVRGLVSLVMVTDDSCGECYDVTVHKQILRSYGVFISEEKTADINSSEGKELVEKYGLTKVPTVVLNGDVAVYSALADIWQQVGTVEEDGAYVFRELDVLRGAVYRNISAT